MLFFQSITKRNVFLNTFTRPFLLRMSVQWCNKRKIHTVKRHIQNESGINITKKSTHHCLKWVLFLAQCFGQMPVIGITKSDSRSLKFRWLSWRTSYCLLNCLGSAFISSVYIYYIIKGGANLYEYGALVFHFNTFIITALFLKLATEWPQLMHKWSYVEFSMRNYTWPQHLQTRIRLLTTVVFVIAAIEYTMTKANSLLISIKYKREDENLFEYYITIHLYSEIFTAISYSAWIGILLQLENVLLTFAWSFNDVFIMVVSTALALQLKRITIQVRCLRKSQKVDNVGMWRKTREDYNRLSKLTKQIDDSLSYIILTSFASNLYSIIMQLFHSLQNMDSSLEKAYFFLSFGFLILRTICVSLYGAWIYDESREPLSILISVPSDMYNIEVRRFLEQVKFDTVALTGKKFFYITRGLILSIAGAIVTYELVLIQFHDNL